MGDSAIPESDPCHRYYCWLHEFLATDGVIAFSLPYVIWSHPPIPLTRDGFKQLMAGLRRAGLRDEEIASHQLQLIDRGNTLDASEA